MGNWDNVVSLSMTREMWPAVRSAANISRFSSVFMMSRQSHSTYLSHCSMMSKKVGISNDLGLSEWVLLWDVVGMAGTFSRNGIEYRRQRLFDHNQHLL